MKATSFDSLKIISSKWNRIGITKKIMNNSDSHQNSNWSFESRGNTLGLARKCLDIKQPFNNLHMFKFRVEWTIVIWGMIFQTPWWKSVYVVYSDSVWYTEVPLQLVQICHNTGDRALSNILHFAVRSPARYCVWFWEQPYWSSSEVWACLMVISRDLVWTITFAHGKISF